MAPCALRLAVPITSADRFGRKHRGPKDSRRFRRLYFFAPLADEALAKSALREFFSPASLRQLPAFRVDSTQLSRGNLHIPSPLYAIMSSAPLSWSFDTDYLQACNCDYGCPCEFSAPPTPGFCEGLGAWRINQGNHGDTRLDGLGLAFAAHWPKAIHEGGGTVCAFIDEKANPAQRDALVQIVSGSAGGLPFEILATTFSKMLEPRFVPFQFHMDGRNSSVQLGDAMRISVVPISNPVTKEPQSVRLAHA